MKELKKGAIQGYILEGISLTEGGRRARLMDSGSFFSTGGFRRVGDVPLTGPVDRKSCSSRYRYSEVDWMAGQRKECYGRWYQRIHRRDWVALASGGQEVC